MLMDLQKGISLKSWRKKNILCFRLEVQRRKKEQDPHPEQDPYPDPFVISTDPSIRIRIWICTKMSRIPNTDKNNKTLAWFQYTNVYWVVLQQQESRAIIIQM
jgi:hypothetical protein